MRCLHILTLIGVIIGSGCNTGYYRDYASMPTPTHGTLVFYDRDGKLQQKLIWRQGKLVSAWQYEQPNDLPLEVLVVIHRGERDYPPKRWIQTVVDGTGSVYYFDEAGEIAGFADYFEGEFWRGMH